MEQSLIIRKTQDKTTVDTTSHPLAWLFPEKQKAVSVGPEMELLEPCALLVHPPRYGKCCEPPGTASWSTHFLVVLEEMLMLMLM